MAAITSGDRYRAPMMRNPRAIARLKAALAAGKQLHAHVDVREFAAQAETDKGFWVRRAEIISSHPRLPKRVAALLKAGVTIPARSQLTLTSAAA